MKNLRDIREAKGLSRKVIATLIEIEDEWYEGSK